MKLFFITSNKDKFNEVKTILLPVLTIEIEQLDQEYPEIQANSLEDVVKFGLEWLMRRLDKRYFNHYIMIEDSGLFITRLKGFPGVYSSFVQKTLGNDAVLNLLDGEWDRRATFETCIGFTTMNEAPKFFKGICEGNLAVEPKGSQGFGFDPIFMPGDEKRTFAEMSMEEKNNFSHRGIALNRLKEYIAANIN